ncbi:MAG TPA: hypothetical protein VIV40_12185 [Kofleriaceae bacterium]
MNIRCVLAVVFVAAVGCTSGSSDPAVTPDSGSSSMARTCDGRAYDLCTDTTASSDCMSGMTCKFFDTKNFTICSPTCNATTPCPPDENGVAVACNMMGRCRSGAPNTCTK